MRKIILSLGIGLFLLSAWAVPGSAALKGDYIEARTADVYTGPCFAMSEVGLTGQEAILAWKVQEGDWNGVPLSGLSVVAVVRANATLGDPYHNPYPAQSVLIVDSRASQASSGRRSHAFAASMAGNLAGPRGASGDGAHPNDGGAWRSSRRGQGGGREICPNRDAQPLPGRPPVRQRIGLLPAAGGPHPLHASLHAGQLVLRTGPGRSLEERGQAQRLCGQLLAHTTLSLKTGNF